MSDKYSRLFAAYTQAISWPSLPPETVHEVKRRIIDSVGVAMAAFEEPASRAARNYADMQGASKATVWGTSIRSTAEAAGFANGVMVRYQDFSDTYLSKEPLHPSDQIAPLLALAEATGKSPKELITAIAIAYELSVNLCDAASIRAYAWDHTNYIAIGAACGAAKLLGLTPAQTEQAISIAIVPHAAMRQTRAGELSMWKGAAAANSARNAVFAALLVSKGMTGPYQPFEGEMGFFRHLTGGKGFDDAALKPIFDKAAPRRIQDTYIKFWPVEYHAQSAVDAAVDLRRQLGNPAAYDSVVIDTFKAAYEIIAKDPEKWAPKTRETADHSLQYITAVALLEGTVTTRSFDDKHLADPRVKALLKNTKLNEDPVLTAGYPAGIPNRITATAKEKTATVTVTHPLGHSGNPMPDAKLVEKFSNNVRDRWPRTRADRFLEVAWKLEVGADLSRLLRTLTD